MQQTTWYFTVGKPSNGYRDTQFSVGDVLTLGQPRDELPVYVVMPAFNQHNTFLFCFWARPSVWSFTCLEGFRGTYEHAAERNDSVRNPLERICADTSELLCVAEHLFLRKILKVKTVMSHSRLAIVLAYADTDELQFPVRRSPPMVEEWIHPMIVID